jgi:hypothetical protein
MQEVKSTEEYVSLEDIQNEEKPDFKARISDFLTGRYFVPIVIVLMAIIAFFLGRISGLQDKKEPVRVISDNSGEVKGISTKSGETETETATTANSSGSVVASKSGTKYHYPWCAGAKQISAKNLITFNSIEAARAAGYTPATNCKGLK